MDDYYAIPDIKEVLENSKEIKEIWQMERDTTKRFTVSTISELYSLVNGIKFYAMVNENSEDKTEALEIIGEMEQTLIDLFKEKQK